MLEYSKGSVVGFHPSRARSATEYVGNGTSFACHAHLFEWACSLTTMPTQSGGHGTHFGQTAYSAALRARLRQTGKEGNAWKPCSNAFAAMCALILRQARQPRPT